MPIKYATPIKSKYVINSESPQAKIWPEIANTHCHICKNHRMIIRYCRDKFKTIPKGYFFCHKCDNMFGMCCNPDHVFLGTNKDNMIDSKMKGRKNHSEATKIKIGNANKGKPSGFKGKHHTNEAKKKLSDAHKGIVVSKQTINRLKKSWYKVHQHCFHPPSKETRLKISIALKGLGKGRSLTKETKDKISKARTGCKLDRINHCLIKKIRIK